MDNEPQVNDIWVIRFSVPYKNNNDIKRPFIITNIFNKIIYGIPLTSFTKQRYHPEMGDFLFNSEKIIKSSIIKPYQIINIKKQQFLNKIETCELTVINKINETIDKNTRRYLAMKNNNSIMREYVIERQNQKIENLFKEITKVKNELVLLQNQLSLITLDKEMILSVTNKIISELQQKLEVLQNQLLVTK